MATEKQFKKEFKTKKLRAGKFFPKSFKALADWEKNILKSNSIASVSE